MKVMKTKIITLLTAVIFVLAGVGITAMQNTAKEAQALLEEVKKDLKVRQNRKITFTNIIETPAAVVGEKPRVLKEKGVVYIKGDLFRLEYGGNIYLFDGKKTYIIMPDDEEVTIMDANEETAAITPTGILKTLEQGKFSYRMGKTATKNGRKIQYIELKPVAASDLELIEIGIDMEQKQLVSFSERGMNKVVNKFVIEAQEIDYKFPPGFFVFKKSDYPNYYIPGL
jgi:outer membrane lipoprotein-sorting protein